MNKIFISTSKHTA